MNQTVIKKLFEKEKLEKDVLNRLMWDKQLDGRDFTLGFLDRFKSKLTELPYNSISLEGEFFKHENSLIPLHRIREIKHKGVVVWAKRKNS